MMEAGKLTRRHLVQAGAASTALVGLGGVGRLEAIAAAAGGPPPELRRGTYLPLAGDRFEIGDPGSARALRLVSVGDLPVAAGDAELSGRDDAFVLRFRGSGERLESGIHSLSHPEVGAFRLFLSPIDPSGPTQDYEVLVDRTVRVPGVVTSERGSSRLPRPPVRLVTARLRRGRGHRLLAEAEIDSADVEIVRAALLGRGRAVSRALAWPRGTEIEISFAPKARAPSGRYALRLELRDRFGNESVARRTLRLR
jgi:hypothetical protein